VQPAVSHGRFTRSGSFAQGAALAALVALLLSASFVQAEPAPQRAGVHLSWVRSPAAMSCAPAGLVQADVVRRLGYDPFGEPSETSLEVAVSKTETSWQAAIEMRSATGDALGSRTVSSDAPACTSLSAAAGLALALMIDPDALTRVVEAKPVAPPARVVPPSPSPSPLPALEPRDSLGSVSVGPVLAGGVLPELALGVELRVERMIALRTYGSVGTVFLPEQRESASSARVNFGLSWAFLGLCQHFPLTAQAALTACASALAGALHSVVIDPVPLRPGERFWFATSLGGRLQWSFWRALGLEAGAELIAPLNRRTYVIESAATQQASATAFQQPALGWLGSAALHVSF
jgi:hypothetical protein